MFKTRVNVGKWIKRNGIFGVRRVNKHNIIYAVFWNKMQNFFYNIAVRVNKTNAVVVPNILAHKELQKFGLAHSGLADNINMPAPVHSFNAENEFLLLQSRFIIGFADKRAVFGLNCAINR